MNKTFSAFAALTSGLLTAGLVWAAPETKTQETKTQEAEGREIETVVVTGEKLNRSLLDTTTSVSVFSGFNIEDQGDASLMEMLNRAANTTANEEGRISIRGIEAASGAIGAPLISVQIDGATLDGFALQGASTQLFDVEQVEVLRGAQSTSQGRNALAGAVIVNTRDPQREWEAKAQLTAEERNGRGVAFAGGGPLSDSFAFRAAVQKHSTDGFITHTPTNDDNFARKEVELLRGKLVFEPTGLPEFRSLLTVARNRADGQLDHHREKGEAGSDPAQRRTTTVNTPTRDDTESTNASWKNEYEINEHFRLTALTAAMEVEQYNPWDQDGTDEYRGIGLLINSGRNLSQELRLNVDYPGRVSGLVGLYGGQFELDVSSSLRDIRITGNDVARDPGTLGGLTGVAGVEVDAYLLLDQRARNRAVFAEFDIELPWRLTATLGLRYDRETLRNVIQSDTTRAELEDSGVDVAQFLVATGALPHTDGPQGGTTHYSALLPKAALRYAVTDDWSVFASYVEAYRPGGVDVDIAGGTDVRYEPEYTSNYEIGARASLAESRVRLGANLFYTQWEDQQVRVFTGQSFVTENAGKSELYGAELSVDWTPFEGLSLYSTWGWLHTEYLEYAAENENFTGNVDYAGNEFNYAPPFTASLGGSLRLGHWMASTNIAHRDKSFTTPANRHSERSDARQQVNARIGWEHEHVSVYLYGRNLLDQNYVIYTFQSPNGYAGAPTPRGFASYSEPRTFGLQMDLRL